MTLTSYSLDVYAADGSTLIANLPTSRALVWQEEVSYPGTQTFEVPLDDAADLTDRRIVKVTEGGSVVFGCRLKGEGTSLAVDGRRWVSFQQQPGLLSLLDDSVVEPEGGLHRTSSTDRLFGFMSAEGDWDSLTWEAPVGVNYNAAYPTNLKRNRQDPTLLKYNPQWIAADPGPNVGVPGGTIDYFRGICTIASAGDYAVMVSGDDYTQLYVDNELIYDSDRLNLYAWRQVQTVTINLTAGDHQFAASVENRDIGSSGNVLAFALAVVGVDSNGDPTGSAVFTTNEVDWIVTTDTPGWRRAQVLIQCFNEAQARAASHPNGVSALTLGFTGTNDSNGDPWDDDPGQYSLPIATASLTDVVATLTESGMNVWVDPDTMTLHAYKRQGADKTGTVSFALGDVGGTLKTLDTTRTVARHTVDYTHLADGTWISTVDTAGRSAYGRIEIGVELGTATTAATAASLAASELAASARYVVAPTAEPSSLAGPQWPADWVLGDTIATRNERNTGTMNARVISATHYRDADTPRDVPELVEDPS